MYPCLEQVSMAQKMFESLKFGSNRLLRRALLNSIASIKVTECKSEQQRLWPDRVYGQFSPFTCMPSRLFYHHSLDMSILYIRGVWLVLLLSCFAEISKLNANGVDPDQTPRSAASGLDLHCLPMPLLRDTGLEWVKRVVAFYKYTFNNI